jgi:hypothetical protein
MVSSPWILVWGSNGAVVLAASPDAAKGRRLGKSAKPAQKAGGIFGSDNGASMRDWVATAPFGLKTRQLVEPISFLHGIHARCRLPHFPIASVGRYR